MTCINDFSTRSNTVCVCLTATSTTPLWRWMWGRLTLLALRSTSPTTSQPDRLPSATRSEATTRRSRASTTWATASPATAHWSSRWTTTTSTTGSTQHPPRRSCTRRRAHHLQRSTSSSQNLWDRDGWCRTEGQARCRFIPTCRRTRTRRVMMSGGTVRQGVGGTAPSPSVWLARKACQQTR